MSGLGFNKIAGAALATALSVFGLQQVSAMMFEVEPVKPGKEGYKIDVPEPCGPKGCETVAETLPDWGTVLATADIAAGQEVFGKCSSCHKPTAENQSQAPGLLGIMGRKPGTHGFAYSPEMIAYGNANPVWTYDQLFTFIRKPKSVIPGTKMGFTGMKDVEDRINLIAYLNSLGGTLPVPAPDPARAPGAAPAAAAPAAEPAGH